MRILGGEGCITNSEKSRCQVPKVNSVWCFLGFAEEAVIWNPTVLCLNKIYTQKLLLVLFHTVAPGMSCLVHAILEQFMYHQESQGTIIFPQKVIKLKNGGRIETCSVPGPRAEEKSS